MLARERHHAPPKAHFVASEAVRPQLGLEVPHHDAAIKGTCDELLHVGVEAH